MATAAEARGGGGSEVWEGEGEGKDAGGGREGLSRQLSHSPTRDECVETRCLAATSATR